MYKILIPLIILVLIVLVGCNLPNSQPTESISPELIFTQAAQTVAAQLTQLAPNVSPTVQIIPTSTLTPNPTETPFYTSTRTPIPCLLVGYSDATIDVTVPDNTIMSPGQAFTKTWRLQNIGTCTWNSSYLLVFDRQDGMGIPSNYSQSLTIGTVAPGQEVDVSVNLIAPGSKGTYTGYWRFRDPNGVYFGIGGSASWVVKIKVINSTTITLSPLPVESGTIRSDAGPFPDFTVGESNADITRTCETFLSYNITSIPTTATITDVKTNFSNYTVVGNPFGLGVLNAYIVNYGLTLVPAAFVSGLPGGHIANWSSTNALNIIESSPDLKSVLQSKLGSNRLQLRLQFGGSNGDAIKDRITFTNPSLVISYTTP
jgi:hypothetical protein